MTVSSEQSSVEYAGNGATTEFPVPFRFLANDTIVVTVDGVAQTEGDDYTLVGAGDDDGTVTFDDAPADDAAIVIERVVALTQTTTFPTQGPFSPATHEAALDHLTMAVQQVQRQFDGIDDDADALAARVVVLEEDVDELGTQADATEAAGEATQAQLDALVVDVGNLTIVDGSVTTAKLANAAVTDLKLAPEAVSSVHLAADAVETAAIDDGAVTTAKLAAGAVTNIKRTPNAVASSVVASFSTTSDTLAAVTGLSATITPAESGRRLLALLLSGGTGGVVTVDVDGDGKAEGELGFSADGGSTFFARLKFGTGISNLSPSSKLDYPPSMFSGSVVMTGATTVSVYARHITGETVALADVRLLLIEI